LEDKKEFAASVCLAPCLNQLDMGNQLKKQFLSLCQNDGRHANADAIVNPSPGYQFRFSGNRPG